jgi:hypothetical protein
MPPRFITWAILLTWLATCGWLFYREILPRFQTDGPPEFFQPNFSDEVRSSALRWVIFQDRKRIGTPAAARDKSGSGTSQFRRRKDRTFELSCEFDFNNQVPLRILTLQVWKITSAYRVGLKGELHELAAEMVMEDISEKKPKPVKVTVNGQVEDGQFTPRFRLGGWGPLDRTMTLPTVAVPANASFLNPMHPLEKVPGLFEGRRWRMPLVDPIGDAVKAWLKVDVGMRYLNAEVSSGTLSWEKKDTPCWVIDYREDGRSRIVARTWVRKTDAQVLEQEAEFNGIRLRMVRGPITR